MLDLTNEPTPFETAESTQPTQSIQQPMSERLERIRLTTRVSQSEWLELLNLHWDDYQDFKVGARTLETKALERIGKRFDFSMQDLLTDNVDYRSLALKAEPKFALLPARYSQAAFGRRRASINSVDFIERLAGWRFRHDLLESLKVPESQLMDPFATISVQFMTDVCSYLNRRQFDQATLFSMGADTYRATRSTLVGRIFSVLPSVRELYEHFFTDFMKLFEENCSYKLVRLSDAFGVLEVRSNSSVAEQMQQKEIGNAHLCVFKAGMISCIPQYLGQSRASVRETKCVHRGDDHCRFEFQYTEIEERRSAISLLS